MEEISLFQIDISLLILGGWVGTVV